MSGRNIVLIGFMGTGKTAVGRRLAEALGREFLDTDAEIERCLGKPVARIFAEEGEPRFRHEEAALCRCLAKPRDLVIATGGGMVLNPENVKHLREGGVLIALTASPEEIFRRVTASGIPPSGNDRPAVVPPAAEATGVRPSAPVNARPLLQGDVRARIRELLAARAGAYDIAELTVETTGRPVEETVRVIMSYLKEKRYLDDKGCKG